MMQMLARWAVVGLILALGANPTSAELRLQLDPEVRDRVLPASVQIAITVKVAEDGSVRSEYVPVGSGTIVSPDGLILTNWHVIDMAAHRAQLELWELQAAEDGVSLALELDDSRLVIFTTEGQGAPQPAFQAEPVAEHYALDFAVLQITSDDLGDSIDTSTLGVPFVLIGDSDRVLQGDDVHVFGYPAIGGGTLQYTTGVVSGFGFEVGIDGSAWITTDASISGGSSGGAATTASGLLIGVPTAGGQLDCRPGDTNSDGHIDAEDIGCIPVGGSIGQLRPINLARDVLARAGYNPDTIEIESDNTSEVASTVATEPSSGVTVPYVFRVDYCRTGPVFPVGTRLVLPRLTFALDEARNHTGPSVTVDNGELRTMSGGEFTVVSTLVPETTGIVPTFIPEGTVVEITGSFAEHGDCDLWPVRYRSPDGVDQQAYIDEWDLRPEVPGQVAPLPPERQFLSTEMETFCSTNADYPAGTEIAIVNESPSYVYAEGVGFLFNGNVRAGTVWEIDRVHETVETGICDMWPLRDGNVRGFFPNFYVHEWDLRPAD